MHRVGHSGLCQRATGLTRDDSRHALLLVPTRLPWPTKAACDRLESEALTRA